MKKGIILTLIVLAIAAFGVYYYFMLTPFSKETEKKVLYIDRDDNIDSVYTKLSQWGKPHAMKAFETLASWRDYDGNIVRGRYELPTDLSTKSLFNKLKRGEQNPLNVPIPSARTLDKLAVAVSNKLELDSTELLNALTDSAVCQKYGFNKQTIAAMFIPDSYNMYWTVSVEEFLDRMKKEYDRFWNNDRQAKAKALGLACHTREAHRGRPLPEPTEERHAPAVGPHREIRTARLRHPAHPQPHAHYRQSLQHLQIRGSASRTHPHPAGRGPGCRAQL